MTTVARRQGPEQRFRVGSLRGEVGGCSEGGEVCEWWSLHAHECVPVEEVECVLDECSQQHVLEGQGWQVVVKEEDAGNGKVWQGVHGPASQQEGSRKGQLEELACRDSGTDTDE